MALAFRGREIGFKDTGRSVNVPDNPKARLMYYLNCLSSVVKLTNDDLDRKYTDYRNYYNLSDSDTRMLVGLCEQLSPSFLEGKCFLRHDELCAAKDTGNCFLDISSKEVSVVATEDFQVLGRELTVIQIMAYSGAWINRNYHSALSAVKNSLRPPSPVYTRRRRSSSCIII